MKKMKKKKKKSQAGDFTARRCIDDRTVEKKKEKKKRTRRLGESMGRCVAGRSNAASVGHRRAADPTTARRPKTPAPNHTNLNKTKRKHPRIENQKKPKERRTTSTIRRKTQQRFVASMTCRWARLPLTFPFSGTTAATAEKKTTNVGQTKKKPARGKKMTCQPRASRDLILGTENRPPNKTNRAKTEP